MGEDFQDFFGDKDIFDVISRYKEMMENKKPSFFDLCEFEDIIEFYLEHGNFTRALEAVKIAIRHYPFASSLKLKHAKILDQNGLNDKALKVIAEIENIEASNHELHLVKGNLLEKLGNHKEAYIEFDRAIKLSASQRDEIAYEIALSFLDSGKENIGLKYLLLAHEINEKNLMVLYELALSFERCDQWEQAGVYYKKFLDIDPFAESVWYGLGYTLSRTGKNKEALEAFDYALALNPKYFSAIFSKGELLSGMEKYNEAIDLYNEILQIDGNNLRAFCLIGDCYIKLGNPDLALHYYKQAKKIDDSYPHAWYGTAMVYKELKKTTVCLQNLQKALKLDKTNADYWFILGITYQEINKKDSARKAFEKATAFDPMKIDAWIAYADILHQNNKTEFAIEVLGKAYQFNYDISTISYKLAVYYSHNRQFVLAKEYFEKGLALNYFEHSEYLHQICIENEEDIRKLLKKYHKN